MSKKQAVLTKGGQVAPAYREPLREKTVEELQEQGWVRQENGQLTKDLFVYQDIPVRAVIDLSISTKQDFSKKSRASKAVDKPIIDINELLKQG